MQRTRPSHTLSLCLLLWAAVAQAQPTETGSAATDPAIALPATTPRDVNELRRAAPRSLQAGAATLGLGRQRLALVVGNGKAGSQLMLPAAERDAQAVATALRQAGFIVMVREDLGVDALRAGLKEYRDRLEPGGVGFVYVTGLSTQVDGQTLLLTRDAPVSTGSQASPAVLARHAVPLAEVISALSGPADSPRLLVLDTAYAHPALASVAPAEPRLPPGMMALLAQAPGMPLSPPPTPPALPNPPPQAPAQLAATPFAQALASAIGQRRVSGPEALRATRRALLATQPMMTPPWLGGETDEREELAEVTLADALVPQSPEELLREGARRVIRRATSGAAIAAAGEQSVAEVLATATPPPPIAPAVSTTAATDNLGIDGRARPASSRNGALADAASSLGTATSVASGVAATAATAAVGLKAAEASAAVQIAARAADLVVTAAGQAVALASRAMTSSPAARPAAAADAAGTAAGAGGGSVAAAAAAATALPAALPLTTPAPPGEGRAQAAAPEPAPVAKAAPQAAPAQALATAAAAAAPAAASATPPPAPTPLPAAVGSAAGPRTALPVSAFAPAANARARAGAADDRTRRTGEQGERPTYQPRSNRFGYTEGDTYTYSIVDTWKGEPLGTTTTSIEDVLDNGHLLANGQQMALDDQGRLLRHRSDDGSVVSYAPVQTLWWANPQRGQSRDLAFTETFERPGIGQGVAEWSGSSSVGRARNIELPGGSFEVLPIESSGWVKERVGNGARVSRKFSRTVWYAPALGHPVAIDIEDVDARGVPLRRERIELLHVQSARSGS